MFFSPLVRPRRALVAAFSFLSFFLVAMPAFADDADPTPPVLPPWAPPWLVVTLSALGLVSVICTIVGTALHIPALKMQAVGRGFLRWGYDFVSIVVAIMSPPADGASGGTSSSRSMNSSPKPPAAFRRLAVVGAFVLAIGLAGCTKQQAISDANLVIDGTTAACVVAEADLPIPQIVTICKIEESLAPQLEVWIDAFINAVGARKDALRAVLPKLLAGEVRLHKADAVAPVLHAPDPVRGGR